MAPIVSEEYKRKKKMDLLEAARKVFIKQGFVRTSMQDIMDEAEVSRGTLYSYFDNIDHVFIEVLKYEDQKNIDYFLPSDEKTLWAQLKNWIEEWQFYIENINQTLVHANTEFFLSSDYVKSKGDSSYLLERYARTTEAIEKLIDEGTRTGEFKPQQSSQSIAMFILSFLNGLMLDTYQLGDEQTKVKDQLSILLYSLEKLINPTALNKE